jgi:hypothetical protein
MYLRDFCTACFCVCVFLALRDFRPRVFVACVIFVPRENLRHPMQLLEETIIEVEAVIR